MPDARQIIDLLQLKPLPVEGGFYAQSYASEETVGRRALPERYRCDRSLCTAIYYMLTAEPESFSALHRLLSDEIWHFYLGDPVEMLLLDPEGGGRRLLLGPDLAAGQRPQQVVPRLTWQGARLLPGGRYALMGTTVAPGYHQQDVEFGRREELQRLYPGQASLIGRLTRG